MASEETFITAVDGPFNPDYGTGSSGSSSSTDQNRYDRAMLDEQVKQTRALERLALAGAPRPSGGTTESGRVERPMNWAGLINNPNFFYGPRGFFDPGAQEAMVQTGRDERGRFRSTKPTPAEVTGPIDPQAEEQWREPRPPERRGSRWVSPFSKTFMSGEQAAAMQEAYGKYQASQTEASSAFEAQEADFARIEQERQARLDPRNWPHTRATRPSARIDLPAPTSGAYRLEDDRPEPYKVSPPEPEEQAPRPYRKGDERRKMPEHAWDDHVPTSVLQGLAGPPQQRPTSPLSSGSGGGGQGGGQGGGGQGGGGGGPPQGPQGPHGGTGGFPHMAAGLAAMGTGRFGSGAYHLAAGLMGGSTIAGTAAGIGVGAAAGATAYLAAPYLSSFIQEREQFRQAFIRSEVTAARARHAIGGGLPAFTMWSQDEQDFAGMIQGTRPPSDKSLLGLVGSVVTGDFGTTYRYFRDNYEEQKDRISEMGARRERLLQEVSGFANNPMDPESRDPTDYFGPKFSEKGARYGMALAPLIETLEKSGYSTGPDTPQDRARKGQPFNQQLGHNLPGKFKKGNMQPKIWPQRVPNTFKKGLLKLKNKPTAMNTEQQMAPVFRQLIGPYGGMTA